MSREDSGLYIGEGEGKRDWGDKDWREMVGRDDIVCTYLENGESGGDIERLEREGSWIEEHGCKRNRDTGLRERE